ncbi:hypothetical protein [Methanosphaerula subterraneus]
MKQGIVGIVVLVGLLICMVIQPVMAETADLHGHPAGDGRDC